MAIVMIAAVFTGCSISNQKAVTTGKNAYSLSKQQETQKEEVVDSTQDTNMSGFFMITQMDTQADIITFYNMQSKRTVSYTYTGGTCFYDKFKELTTQEAMEIGSIVQIETSNVTNALTKVTISDQIWEKDEVSDYTFDTQNDVLTIEGKHYAYSDDTKYFSDDGEITFDQLAQKDVLRIFGKEKQILAVTVVTGHGTLTLTNTKNFDQGWLGLYTDGKTSYYQIKDNIKIELPQGEYQLTASNNGYGAESNITITRNETTSVDLEQIKSETPKNCMITFQTSEPTATLYLDGRRVDMTQPVEVQYGTHSLTANADGYDTWSRKLVVNSPQATIEVQLTKQSDESDTQTTEKSSSSQKATTSENATTNNTTGSSANTGSTGNTTGSSQAANSSNTTGTTSSAAGSTSSSNSATDSYLSTLSGIIDTLTNDSEKSSE